MCLNNCMSEVKKKDFSSPPNLCFSFLPRSSLSESVQISPIIHLAADSSLAPLIDNSTLLFTANLCVMSVKHDRAKQQQQELGS